MKKYRAVLHLISTVTMALFTISCGFEKKSHRSTAEGASLDAAGTNLVSPLQITHLSLLDRRTGKDIDGYSNLNDVSEVYLEDLPVSLGIKAHFNYEASAKNFFIKIPKLNIEKVVGSPFIYRAMLPQINMEITISLRPRDLDGRTGEFFHSTLFLKNGSRPISSEPDNTALENDATDTIADNEDNSEANTNSDDPFATFAVSDFTKASSPIALLKNFESPQVSDSVTLISNEPKSNGLKRLDVRNDKGLVQSIKITAADGKEKYRVQMRYNSQGLMVERVIELSSKILVINEPYWIDASDKCSLGMIGCINKKFVQTMKYDQRGRIREYFYERSDVSPRIYNKIKYEYNGDQVKILRNRFMAKNISTGPAANLPVGVEFTESQQEINLASKDATYFQIDYNTLKLKEIHTAKLLDYWLSDEGPYGLAYMFLSDMGFPYGTLYDQNNVCRLESAKYSISDPIHSMKNERFLPFESSSIFSQENAVIDKNCKCTKTKSAYECSKPVPLGENLKTLSTYRVIVLATPKGHRFRVLPVYELGFLGAVPKSTKYEYNYDKSARLIKRTIDFENSGIQSSVLTYGEGLLKSVTDENSSLFRLEWK